MGKYELWKIRLFQNNKMLIFVFLLDIRLLSWNDPKTISHGWWTHSFFSRSYQCRARAMERFNEKSTVKSRRPWLNLHQILSCGCNKTSQNMLPLALGGLMWMCLQKEGTFPAADIQNVIRQKSEQRLDRGRGFMSCNCLDHSVLHASWYCSLHSDVHQAQCGQFF